jgi:hypothetical protein
MCWLYGKQLHNELGVPVGLVSSAVGGAYTQEYATPLCVHKVVQVFLPRQAQDRRVRTKRCV